MRRPGFCVSDLHYSGEFGDDIATLRFVLLATLDPNPASDGRRLLFQGLRRRLVVDPKA